MDGVFELPTHPRSERRIPIARFARRGSVRLGPDPRALYRTGHALILSSGITSAFGVAYWFLAARIYSREAVGLNSAAISAFMFLAGIAQLNMGSALARFVPAAGRGAGALIRTAYVVSVAFAALLSVAFLTFVHWWTPRLGFLVESPAFIATFVVATMAWCVFNLQDSALAGLRRVGWVPIENGVYAAAKLGLLVLFAAPFPRYGLYLSWTAALAVVLVPVTVMILRQFVVQHEHAARERAPIDPRVVVRYVRGDFLGSFFWLGALMLPPILVTDALGPISNAYFALAWVITYSLYLISSSMSMSLLVAEAADEGHLAARTYRVLRHTAMLVVPLVGVLLVSAPWILSIFGREYADDGTRVLRLLALSAIPNIVNAVYVGAARAQRRVVAATVVLGSLFVLVTGLSIMLLPVIGVNGAGWAWLIAQLVVATAVYRFRLRPLFSARDASERALVSRGFAPRAMVRCVHATATTAGRSRALTTAAGWRRREHARLHRSLVGEVLREIQPIDGHAPPRTWVVHGSVPSLTGVFVARLGPANEPPLVVLHVARGDGGPESLAAHHRVVDALRADARLLDWSALVPEVIGSGTASGAAYLVERAAPGEVATGMLTGRHVDRPRVLRNLADAIGELHQRTAERRAIADDVLARWLEPQLEDLRRLPSCLPSAVQHRALAVLADEISGGLTDRTSHLTYTHGDFTPGNVLVDADAAVVTGIIDWDRARRSDLSLVDIAQLLISSRALTGAEELGATVVGLLGLADWDPFEQEIIDRAAGRFADPPLGTRPLVLLSWLRHVENNLSKCGSYRRNPVWLHRNVEAVLGALAR